METLTDIRDSGLDWNDKVREGIRALITIYQQHYPAPFVLMDEVRRDSSDIASLTLVPVLTKYRQVWMEILQQGMDDGRIDKSLDVKLAYFIMLGMCNWMSRWYRSDGKFTAHHIADQISHIFLEGVNPRS